MSGSSSKVEKKEECITEWGNSKLIVIPVEGSSAVARKLFNAGFKSRAEQELSINKLLRCSCFLLILISSEVKFFGDQPYLDFALDEGSQVLHDTLATVNIGIVIGDLVLGLLELFRAKVIPLDLQAENCLLFPSDTSNSATSSIAAEEGKSTTSIGTLGFSAPETIIYALRQSDYQAKQSQVLFQLGLLLHHLTTKQNNYYHSAKYDPQTQYTRTSWRWTALNLKPVILNHSTCHRTTSLIYFRK